MSADDEDRVLASVRTRTFRRRQAWAILIIVFVGLNVVFLGAMLGVHPLVLTGILLAATFLGVAVQGGDAEVAVTDDGLRQRWQPLLRLGAWGRPRERFVPWSAVRRCRHDVTMTRGLEEVEFLEVDVATRPRRLVITGRQDPMGFAAFRDALLARMEADARAARDRGEPPPIALRPVFHRTWMAHLLTALFVAATAVAAVSAALGVLETGHLVRLGLVLVPGTAYFVWRTWIRRT